MLLTELNNLTADLETFQKQNTEEVAEINTEEELELGNLLKMVINRNDFDVDVESDNLLFRLKVLWEEVEVILKKSHYVLEELSINVREKTENDAKSVSSSTTKRSALSQSVAVFKMKEQKKAENERINIQRQKRSFKDCANVISSDYKLVCPGKEEVVTERRGCCFRK
jgi:hypothetical protein